MWTIACVNQPVTYLRVQKGNFKFFPIFATPSRGGAFQLVSEPKFRRTLIVLHIKNLKFSPEISTDTKIVLFGLVSDGVLHSAMCCLD